MNKTLIFAATLNEYPNIRTFVKKIQILNLSVDLLIVDDNSSDGTLEFLKEFEKKNFLISLPKIKKNFQMDFFKWSFNNPLIINEYGIPEPISNKIRYPDILLVPLVAFDGELNRIGYGGGFYDRYIKKIKKTKKLITFGLAFSFQKVNKIPTNKFDSKLDFIITEKKRI